MQFHVPRSLIPGKIPRNPKPETGWPKTWSENWVQQTYFLLPSGIKLQFFDRPDHILSVIPTELPHTLYSLVLFSMTFPDLVNFTGTLRSQTDDHQLKMKVMNTYRSYMHVYTLSVIMCRTDVCSQIQPVTE
jgi:hypothetical protein